MAAPKLYDQKVNFMLTDDDKTLVERVVAKRRAAGERRATASDVYREALAGIRADLQGELVSTGAEL